MEETKLGTSVSVSHWVNDITAEFGMVNMRGVQSFA